LTFGLNNVLIQPLPNQSISQELANEIRERLPTNRAVTDEDFAAAADARIGSLIASSRGVIPRPMP
jgi:hypothetical protein